MMDGEKVIIERRKLESMEKELAGFRSECEQIKLVHFSKATGILGTATYTESEYIGKDDAIQDISARLNALNSRKKEIDEKYNNLKDRVLTASFFARLKYLFTKEL
jgi:hypothetical protein